MLLEFNQKYLEDHLMAMANDMEDRYINIKHRNHDLLTKLMNFSGNNSDNLRIKKILGIPPSLPKPYIMSFVSDIERIESRKGEFDNIKKGYFQTGQKIDRIIQDLTFNIQQSSQIK